MHGIKLSTRVRLVTLKWCVKLVDLTGYLMETGLLNCTSNNCAKSHFKIGKCNGQYRISFIAKKHILDFAMTVLNDPQKAMHSIALNDRKKRCVTYFIDRKVHTEQTTWAPGLICLKN